MPSPKLVPLELTDDERQVLEGWVRRRKTAQSLSLRSRIILACADGGSNQLVADELGVSRDTVSKWRSRFLKARLSGLTDEPRPGRPRMVTDEKVEQVVAAALEQAPPGGDTHWSTRMMARQAGVSQSTVSRIWRTFGLKPHVIQTWKLSTDPQFTGKVRDVVGLYMAPPEHALVLCVDEKSQVQALERTQPVLPMGLGYIEGVTHDYYRHGTTTLFAALDVLDGKVITMCKPRHRHQEFLTFLDHLDRSVPPGLDIHLIADNYGTHKHPKVKAWLARRPRYHIHYTPTYASWLNQVERWFGLITQQAIRRGSFRSVSELVQKIDAYVANYNLHQRPFAWTASADSILAKLQRLCKLINGTSH
jgi:putative transposase